MTISQLSLRTLMFIGSFLSLVFAHSALAGFMIGGSLGAGAVAYREEISTAISQTSETGSQGTSMVSLRIGSKGESSRSYANMDVLVYSDADIQTLTWSYDWLHGNGRSRFVSGISLGIASLTWKEDDPFNSGLNMELDGESARHFTLGGRIGSLAELNSFMDLELMLSLQVTNLKTEIRTIAGTERYSLDVNLISALTVGINFSL